MNTKHLKPFPAGKTAEELGIDTSKKFVVVDNGNTVFNTGEILMLIENDGTSAPYFSNGKTTWNCLWSDLAYAPNQKINKKPYHFILVWEEEKDPIKFFHTRTEALEFAKTLPENAHDIQLVEIKTLEKVEIVSEKKVKIVK